MARIKLYGNTRKRSRQSTAVKRRRPPVWQRALIPICILLLLFCSCYLAFTYSAIPFIANARHMLIETAMSTMRHQWIATALFPESVVQEVMQTITDAKQEQIGVNSTWEDPPEVIIPPDTEKLRFLALFRELDETSLDQYLERNPELLDNGWDNLYINEAGLDDEGTTIKTVAGDQVLAIDAKNGVLLIRVAGTGYRGVLAIAKDSSRLSIQTASTLGEKGEVVGKIARDHNGILAMTASAFVDVDQYGNAGKGNGALISGLAVCDGVLYGQPMGPGCKRAELRSDNLLYIVDSLDPVHEDCTDAAEFTPALIVDGKVIVDENCGWNAINPRTCIGQNAYGDFMMLCIEGRLVTSLGVGVVECAGILHRYGCMQAMNLDGGTSSILWFDGEYVTRCSNTALPSGRPLPNAFIFTRAEENTEK